jgi:hypothetical protein
MSLVSDWADWVDNNVIEKTKSVLGEAIEYAAPENTRRRTVLNKIGEVQRAVGAGISTAALLTDKDNPEFQDGFQLSHIVDLHKKFLQCKQCLVHQTLPHLIYQHKQYAQVLN